MAVVILVASGATLVVETLFDGVAGFFAARPLAAGFVSGVILALLASAVIRAIVESRRAARWDAVSRAGFGSLAHDVTAVVDTLNWLVTGHPPQPDERIDDEDMRRLDEVQVQFLGGPVAAEDPRAAGSGPHKVPHDLYSARLRALLDSDDWERIAITAIARARARHRRGLALWTAALSATGELADVLVRLARLNESGNTVEAWLRLRRGWSGWDIEPPCDDDDVVDAWFAFLAEMLSVREDLWRISLEEQDDVWRWFRAPLPPPMRAELNTRAMSAHTDSARRATLARATSTATLKHPRSLVWH